MKTNTCITLDMDLIMEIRRQKLSLSPLINEYMRAYLKMPKAEKVAYTRLNEEILLANAKVADLTKQKEEFDKKVEDGEIKVIKKEETSWNM